MGVLFARMTSTGGNITAGYPDPAKRSVLNWGCGKFLLLLGMKTSASPCSLCLLFASSAFLFRCVFPAQAREGCFHLVCKAETLTVKNTGSGEENTHPLLHLHCILSPAKLWVGVNHVCNAFSLFSSNRRVCDLYHKAAYFVTKLEWVNLLMSLSLSLHLLAYRGIYPILLSFWLWRWNWSKGSRPLFCWESTFIPKQANVVA